MKIIFSLISFLVVLTGYSQEFNVGLSIRPLSSIINSNTDFFPNDTSSSISLTKSHNVTTLLNFEIVNSRSFFHSIILGVNFFNSINNQDNVFKNKLIYSEERSSKSNKYIIGYGFGKYFNMYKEQLFIKLENNILGKFSHSNSRTIQKEYDANEQIRKELISNIKYVNVYSVEYELKPSLIYRLKFFSIGLSIPLGLEFNTFNGKQTFTSNTINYYNNTESNDEYILDKKANYFYFNYNLDLSLRFHFKPKKKKKE